MSGEKNADLAVKAILNYFETGLPTYLTSLESAQSLVAGSMEPPVDYVAANLPDDLRSPLFECWCDSSRQYEPEATGTVSVPYSNDCKMGISFSSDADVEEAQAKARRYMTALNDLLIADRTLGAKVVVAVDTDHTFYANAKGKSQTRHSVLVDLNVITFNT
jgi:hypothetical protein